MLEVIDDEVESLGVSLTASNGRFRGTITAIYGGPDDVAALADGLAGFPTSALDVRVFELGIVGIGDGSGWARLGFRVADAVGHAVLDVQLAAVGWTSNVAGSLPETASFSLAIDAASLDRFVSQLHALVSARSGAAHLEASS